jgi:hypothetical protein
MTTPEVRRLSGFLLAFLVALLPSAARAGTFPYWGLSFGASERTAASLGVTLSAT